MLSDYYETAKRFKEIGCKPCSLAGACRVSRLLRPTENLLYLISIVKNVYTAYFWHCEDLRDN